MLHIDIFSAYVIAGSGSLVCAGMMLLADADEALARLAIRVFMWGFVVLGLGLVQVGFVVDDGATRSVGVLLAAQSTLAGVALFGWAFAFLGGIRPPRFLVPLVVLLLLANAWAWTGSPRLFAIVFHIIAVAVTLLVCVPQWRLMIAARSLAERQVGVSLLFYAASWLARFGFMITDEGTPRFHLTYMPDVLLPWLALFYAAIPIIIAALTLNVINARMAARLRSTALTDELTGALSRRALRELAPAAIARERAKGRRIATLMVDIDHFKTVNDRHGHLGGDAVLRRAAELLRTSVRSDAVVTRYGGEEFALLIPVTDIEEARAVAERVRGAFEVDRCGFEGARIGVTISGGVCLVEPGESLEAALGRADAALYCAKNEGRNRIETGAPLEPTAP